MHQQALRGYLLREPNKGLFYMFQMMNESRINVGLGAAAIASAAYYAALEYARERPQGRPVSTKDPASPQVPIIEHADIRRMLLFQRAVVEGSFALLMQCGMYADMEKVTQGEELFLADASLYIELFGIIVIAWQWLAQAIVATKALNNGAQEKEHIFYQGKIYAFRYFFKYELPKIEGLYKRLKDTDGLTLEVKNAYF